jgi:hypothetical protein
MLLQHLVDGGQRVRGQHGQHPCLQRLESDHVGGYVGSFKKGMNASAEQPPKVSVYKALATGRGDDGKTGCGLL